MPSCRPVKPNPSVVVALTLTREAVDGEDRRDPLDHGLAIGSDARTLADQGYVDRNDAPAPRRDERGRMGEEAGGIGTPPLRIAGRKMHPDIAGADGTQQGIGERMKADVGIRMSLQAPVMRHGDAAEHHLVARTKPVDVEAVAAAQIDRRRQQALGAQQIGFVGDLEIVLRPGDKRDGEPRCLGDGGIVGELAPRCGAMGRQDLGIAEGLGRLGAKELGPVQGLRR